MRSLQLFYYSKLIKCYLFIIRFDKLKINKEILTTPSQQQQQRDEREENKSHLEYLLIFFLKIKVPLYISSSINYDWSILLCFLVIFWIHLNLLNWMSIYLIAFCCLFHLFVKLFAILMAKKIQFTNIPLAVIKIITICVCVRQLK